jgi:hypothetical protein
LVIYIPHLICFNFDIHVQAKSGYVYLHDLSRLGKWFMSETIECPHCGGTFALSEAFTKKFEEEKQHAIHNAVQNSKRKFEEEKTRLEKEFSEERKELQRSIEQQAQKSAQKEYELKLKEKDLELERINTQLKDLQRRTQQGSMELQGEALEAYLKELLTTACPDDTISDVLKGQSGADFIHEVVNRSGQRCGKIVWETKNTKSWNNDWLHKVKENAARANAAIKVIVSVALPREIKTFDLIEDVWVTTLEAAPALARALRENLLYAATLERAMQGREGKMEQVYAYLISNTFHDRVKRMTETWTLLKKQIDAEETAMKKQWKERRKQLETITDVTTEMYTDISCIIGQEMPQVEAFILDALPSGNYVDEREG